MSEGLMSARSSTAAQERTSPVVRLGPPSDSCTAAKPCSITRCLEPSYDR
jgi:hypothetical protein